MNSISGEITNIMLDIVIIINYVMFVFMLISRFENVGTLVVRFVKYEVISSFIMSLSRSFVKIRKIIPNIIPSISAIRFTYTNFFSINFFILNYIKVF